MQHLLSRYQAVNGLRRYVDRFTCSLSQTTQPASTSEPTEEYRTQRKPIYSLPFYGATDTELENLSDNMVEKAVKSYGGLLRKKDSISMWRERLRGLTNASHRPNQLTIEGVVVSDKMAKSVVVAARRRAFSSKYEKHFFKTRRFMAHDEFDLCREGDRVLIRSCRMLSKRKTHVVVQNFGDQTKAEVDSRKIVLEPDD